ncbi:pentapeptide repeat-containing protein [Streptomyces purpureus]|uniref:pentapeptide repeat-containing protein n=1 Tax=Streptomyces purpureus TaxID=1951 RepID=UPI00378B69A6
MLHRRYPPGVCGASEGSGQCQPSTRRGAHAQRASFRAADLRTADLRGTDLTGADLHDADLTGARADARTRWPEGIDPTQAGVVLAEERDPRTPSSQLSGFTLRTDLPPLRSYP